MNNDRAKRTIGQACIKLSKGMKLQFAGAISSDYKLEYKNRYTLDETYRLFTAFGIKESEWIVSLITEFLQTNTYRPVSLNMEMWNSIPGICSELVAWGFAKPNDQTSKYNEKQFAKDVTTFVSTGEVGFSFGSNTHLFRFLIPQILSAESHKYIIYAHHDELSSFPELPDLLSKRFDEIVVRSIDYYKYNARDLKECHISGKTRRMNTTMQKKLSKMCGVEYSELHCEGENELKTNYYPKNLDIFMARKASLFVFKRINVDLPEKIMNLYNNNSRKIILIVTRDNVWAGPGQECRELKIKDFEETIDMLTKLKYNVVRLNLYGENAEFHYEGFIDMADGEYSRLDQLAIIGKADFIVGADTGLTGFAQIAGTIPTLAIGHPDLYPHSPWGEVVMMSKPLEIMDTVKFSSHELDELTNKLFAMNNTWSDDYLKDFGLAIKSLSPAQIKKEVLNFIQQAEMMNMSKYKTTNDLGLNKIMKCNVLISDFTFKNLKDIIGQRENPKN